MNSAWHGTTYDAQIKAVKSVVFTTWPSQLRQNGWQSTLTPQHIFVLRNFPEIPQAVGVRVRARVSSFHCCETYTSELSPETWVQLQPLWLGI